MAELTLTGSSIGSDYAYYAESSTYPLTNPLGKTASAGTGYGGVNLTRNSGGITYWYVIFDASEVPQDVIIQSVTGNIKMYGSTTAANRVNTKEVQIYSGTTAKGTSSTYSLTGSGVTSTLDGGTDWTRSELDDLRIRVYAVRNSSSTTSNTYLYWMGADITITYEEDSGVVHTVTITAGDGLTVNPTGENEVKEGNSFTVSITPDTTTIKSITDNGTDVLSSLQQQFLDPTSTVTSYPTAYEVVSGSIRGTYYQNCIGYGSSNTASGNDYASSSGSTATIAYSFDFSSIPENATIESVEVIVGGHLESTSNSNEVARLQLYSGSTAKGSQSSFSSTSKELVTMSAGTWTRDELQDATLQFTIGYYGGQVNGVDFNVVYSLPNSGTTYYVYVIDSVAEDHIILINMEDDSPVMFIKQNGTWNAVTKGYRKVDGVWTEIDLSTLSTTTNYVIVSS